MADLDGAVEDAVELKFLDAPLTKEQLAEFLQIPPRRSNGGDHALRALAFAISLALSGDRPRSRPTRSRSRSGRSMPGPT